MNRRSFFTRVMAVLPMLCLRNKPVNAQVTAQVPADRDGNWWNTLGATLTGKYGDSSIADTMKSFAPGSDGNDPVKYAATLASAVGVPVSTKISALSSAQLMTFQYSIAVAEGYNSAGNSASYSAPPQ